jgi:glutaredoxin
MAMNEIQSFNNSIKVFSYYPNHNDFREKEFYFVGLSRIKRIVGLIELINANEKRIMKLDEINRRNGSPYIFMTSLDFVRSFLKSGKKYAKEFKTKYGRTITLAVILVGENPASQVYVRNKIKATEYVGMKSLSFTLPESSTENEVCECVAEEKTNAADGTFLFTTATCPNCKIACSLLDKAGVAYEKLLANEHAQMATDLGIKQAPTLVVIKDGAVSKFAGVSDIKKFLNA